MGRLLRALKLEDPLPQGLADPAKKIGDMEKKLSSSRVISTHALAIAKTTAKKIQTETVAKFCTSLDKF